jgi:hypothetical protein
MANAHVGINLTDEQREKIIPRLHQLALEHGSKPEIAQSFLRIAESLAA